MQGVRDWKATGEKLRERPKSLAALLLREGTEKFFLSDWFRLLARVDCEEILTMLLD